MGWRTELDLSGSQSLDDHHRGTTLTAWPTKEKCVQGQGCAYRLSNVGSSRAPCQTQNLSAMRFLAHVVENAIRTNHDFAQRTSRAAGISWPNIRKVCQNSNVREYAAPDPSRSLRVMLGDVGLDVLKV